MAKESNVRHHYRYQFLLLDSSLFFVCSVIHRYRYVFVCERSTSIYSRTKTTPSLNCQRQASLVVGRLLL